MSYLVLARKYRPQAFDQVSSQDHITNILANTIKLNRIAHAYLFTGPRGVGKTSMARIFAKSLNCLTSGPTTTPCNECQNCVEITKGISTDVIEIDGASNTGVEDIRELQKELMYSTANSRYKIYIIDEVHMLSKNAFNALLKTLEEPPENVLFIFATTEPHKVLATIISRCQRFDFKRIPISDIVARLKFICEQEEIKTEEEALFLIAKKADGSMRDALSLMDQLLAFGKDKLTHQDVLDIFGIVPSERYHRILENILNKESAAVINLLHETIDKGNDLQEFINGLMDYIRDLLLIKLNIPKPEISKQQISEMKKLSDDFSENELLFLITLLIKTKADIKNSGNPVMLAEMSFVKLAKLTEIRTLDEILADLKDQGNRPFIKVHRKIENKNMDQKEPELFSLSKENNQGIKIETELEKPDIKELNLDIITKYHNILAEKIKRESPFLVTYFRGCKPLRVVNNLIKYQIGSELAHKMLRENPEPIKKIISKYFNLKARVEFVLVKNKKEQKISNPSLNEIKKESPDLADFIETTDSVIS